MDEAVGASVRLIAGISLGAHAAARWAARREAHRLDGLWLVLPAWTGEPDEVAALSAAAADEIAAEGTPSRTRAGGPPGVGRRRARPGVARVRRAAAHRRAAPDGRLRAAGSLRPGGAHGPVRRRRDRATTPSTRPLVAEQWAAAIPRAALRLLAPAEPAADVAALGQAALLAWGGTAEGRTARSNEPPRGSQRISVISGPRLKGGSGWRPRLGSAGPPPAGAGAAGAARGATMGSPPRTTTTPRTTSSRSAGPRRR